MPAAADGKLEVIRFSKEDGFRNIFRIDWIDDVFGLDEERVRDKILELIRTM